MSGENETTVSGNPEPSDDGLNTSSQEWSITKDEHTRAIKREVAAVKAKMPDPDEFRALQEKVAAFEQAQLSEQEKLQAKIQALETERQKAIAEAEAARLDAIRVKVAHEKGIPATLAARLTGSTEDEIAADADAVLADLSQLQTQPRRTASTDAAAGTRQQSTGGLTDEERQYAIRYGLTEEQFIKYKQSQPKGTNING